MQRSELCRLEKSQITGIKMPEEKSFSTEIPHHSHSCLETFAPDEIMIMMIYDAQYVMGRFFYALFFLARKIAYLVFCVQENRNFINFKFHSYNK